MKEHRSPGNMSTFRYLVFAFATSLLLSSCSSGGDGQRNSPAPTPNREAYSYSIPTDLVDGWLVGHVADQGLDAQIVEEMMDAIINDDFPGIDSISVARNAVLVLSEDLRTQLDEYDALVSNTSLDRHILHSTSKSFISALVGIAIEQGYFSGVDTQFYDLFTYASYDNWDTAKSQMTLEDALTMRLGYEWDEWSVAYGSAGNSLFELSMQEFDVTKGLLDLPLSHEPGEQFVYNTAGTISIGQAIENAVGVPLEDFADQHLFAPLNIVDAVWAETSAGIPNGGSGLYLTTREMVKFGQLYIDDGVWNGEQVIDANWISQSVQPHSDFRDSVTSGYGYQWWIDDFEVDGQQIESYSTRGFGGQYIFCVPSLRLVVAFTGENYGTIDADQTFWLMQNYILQAAL